MRRTSILGLLTLMTAFGMMGLASTPAASSSVDRSYTYVGQLQSGEKPYTGQADFRFSLWNSAEGGAQIAPVQSRKNVTVENGTFRVSLRYDEAVLGGERWLEIAVRAPSGDGSFTTLKPRRQVFASGNDTLGDFVGDDVSPLQSAIDRILNSPGSMLFNIDYDNDTNNEAFILAKDRMGDSGGTELMRVQENGRVGIGTNNPLERFQVADDFYVDSAASFTGVNRNARVTGAEYFGIQAPTGDNVYGGMYIRTDGAGGWPFYGYANSGGGGMWTYYDGTAEKWHVNMGGNRLTVDGSNGNVGIGDTTPAATLTVGNGDKFQVNGSQGDVGFVDDQASITFPATDANNSPMVHMFASGTTNGDRMVIAHSPSFPTWGVQYQDNGDQFNFLGGGTSAMTVELGSRRVGINTDSPGRTLDVNGTARVSILEIAGADLAEAFPFSAREETIEPGSVVAIDPENPGELCLARGAYNTCVAGVIAGANDFSTGVVLGADPATEHLNKHPVALSGRVYVKCDASNGAIRPGDMLTTSDRPGYAMKVTEHDRARGAVIGKAMSALEGGEGMVLVLVTLQ